MTETEQPCVAGSAGLTADMLDTDVLAKHIDFIAQMNTRMDNRKSGKTFPVKWSCSEYCAGLAWGPSCAPCAVSSLKTKEACLFSGPFLTGELCHRNAKTKEVTSEPCCNLPDREKVGDYDIASATTCVIGRNCKCKKFGDGEVDQEDVHGIQRNVQKFEASYLYNLPRKFEDGICSEVNRCEKLWSHLESWKEECGPDPYKTLGCTGGDEAKPRKDWAGCCFDPVQDCSEL